MPNYLQMFVIYLALEHGQCLSAASFVRYSVYMVATAASVSEQYAYIHHHSKAKRQVATRERISNYIAFSP